MSSDLEFALKYSRGKKFVSVNNLFKRKKTGVHHTILQFCVLNIFHNKEFLEVSGGGEAETAHLDNSSKVLGAG